MDSLNHGTFLNCAIKKVLMKSRCETQRSERTAEEKKTLIISEESSADWG